VRVLGDRISPESNHNNHLMVILEGMSELIGAKLISGSETWETGILLLALT